MDPTQIAREMSGKKNFTGHEQSRRTASRPPKATRPGQTPAYTKPKREQAPERASMLAEVWVSTGNALGWDFPYDVNFLALALHRKIETEPEFKPYFAADRGTQVERWVLKMIERWYAEYTTEAINARNAKEYFLSEDWDDVLDYARTCLVAAHLKVTGRRIESPVYPEQQDYQDRLAEIRKREGIDGLLRKVDEAAEDARESPSRVEVKDRERVRSWREQRADKRSRK